MDFKVILDTKLELSSDTVTADNWRMVTDEMLEFYEETPFKHTTIVQYNVDKIVKIIPIRDKETK